MERRGSVFNIHKWRHVVLVTPHRLAYCRGVLRGVAEFAGSRVDGGDSAWRFTVIDPARADAQALRRLDPDGIISLVFIPRLAQRLCRSGVPVISISDSLPDLALPLVTSDDAAVGRLAAAHLLATGLTRFACIGYAGYGFSRQRLRGFRAGIAAAADGRHRGAVAKLAAPFLITGRADVDPSDDLQHDVGDLAAWLRALVKPVGIFAVNDVLGLRIIGLCRDLGLRVPDDVAVVGVDDDDLLCSLARPPLSSVALPTAEIGKATAAWLDRLMTAGRKITQESARERLLLPPLAVVARQSSDLLAVADPDLAAAQRWMRDNFHRPVTIRDLLRAVPIARRALERRFQRHFARSPADELTRLRLDRARHLLATSDLAITEIADRCGFSEARLLSAALRRSDGVTARGWRARSRDGVGRSGRS